MIQPRPTLGLAWRNTIQTGAIIGIGLTLIYTSLFILYAIGRSTLTILAALPLNMSLLGTLVANSTSIAVASYAIALLLAIPMAFLGMGTAFVAKWLDSTFNKEHAPQRALISGFGAALAFVLLFDLSLQWLMGQTLASLGLETYLFWFGLPGLLHIGGGVAAAWYLYHTNNPFPVFRKEAFHVSAILDSRGS